jgi:uncharacterized membrane protein (UPF0182 family)
MDVVRSRALGIDLLDVYLALLWLVHIGFILVFRRKRTVVVRFGITSVVVLGTAALFMAVAIAVKCTRSAGLHRLDAGH